MLSKNSGAPDFSISAVAHSVRRALRAKTKNEQKFAFREGERYPANAEYFVRLQVSILATFSVTSPPKYSRLGADAAT